MTNTYTPHQIAASLIEGRNDIVAILNDVATKNVDQAAKIVNVLTEVYWSKNLGTAYDLIAEIIDDLEYIDNTGIQDDCQVALDMTDMLCTEVEFATAAVRKLL